MSMNILIFEDNYIAAMALELMVEQIGGSVVASHESADDILTQTDQHTVDCILMDIQLAGNLNGIEAVEKLREHNDVPVIFISGNDEGETTEKIKPFGNTLIITKPYTEADLRKGVTELGLKK